MSELCSSVNPLRRGTSRRPIRNTRRPRQNLRRVKATEPPFEYERTDEAAWQVKRSGDVTYDDLGSMVPEHTMGTGKTE